MWIPKANDVLDVHGGLVALFEKEEDSVSPPGVRSENLLESACMRPHTGGGGADKYDTLYRKCAALFHSLTKNHPFHNGNKRTALVTILRTLDRNDKRLANEVTDDELFDFVVAVTGDEFPKPDHGKNVDEVVEEISQWLKSHTTAVGGSTSGMTAAAFIERCKQSGAKYKQGRGGSHCLSRSGGSVKFSQATRQFDGAVVRQYLRKLGLSEKISGFTIDEFQDGTSTEREQIYRFMSTLRRLAKT